jgi:hypothetical protein
MQKSPLTYQNPYPQTNGNTHVEVQSAGRSSIQNLSTGKIKGYFRYVYDGVEALTIESSTVITNSTSLHQVLLFKDGVDFQFRFGNPTVKGYRVVSANLVEGAINYFEIIINGITNEIKIGQLVDGVITNLVSYTSGNGLTFEGTGSATSIGLTENGITDFLIGKNKVRSVGVTFENQPFKGLIAYLEFTDLSDVSLFKYDAGYNGIEPSISHPVELINNNSLKLSCNNNIEDLSDANNTINQTGTIDFEDDFYGRKKQSLRLDATGYLKVPNSALLYPNLDSFSVSFWFKIDSSAGQYIMVGGSNVGFKAGYSFFTSGGDFLFRFSDGALNTDKSFTASSNWNLLTSVFDRNLEKQFLYLNESLINEVDISNYGSIASVEDFNIGSYNGTFPTTGNLDDINLYDYALSAIDRKALYKSVIKRDTVNFTTDGSVTVGITTTFSTGKTYIKYSDGFAQTQMISGVEDLHTLTSGKNYEGEITNAVNHSAFNCDASGISTLNLINLVNVKTLSLINNGIVSAEIDKIIIDLNDAGVTNCAIAYITGNSARTAASDTAYNNLVANGCTFS